MLTAMGTTERTNPAFVALVVVGALAAIGGVIIWIFAAQAVASAELTDYYRDAISGDATGGAVAQAQFGVWIGIAILILGAVMLVAALVIRAARPSR